MNEIGSRAVASFDRRYFLNLNSICCQNFTSFKTVVLSTYQLSQFYFRMEENGFWVFEWSLAEFLRQWSDGKVPKLEQTFCAQQCFKVRPFLKEQNSLFKDQTTQLIAVLLFLSLQQPIRPSWLIAIFKPVGRLRGKKLVLKKTCYITPPWGYAIDRRIVLFYLDQQRQQQHQQQHQQQQFNSGRRHGQDEAAFDSLCRFVSFSKFVVQATKW